MLRSKIAGIGMYVPANVVTNNDLLKYMDTSDECIQERTGIKERRYAHRTDETTTTSAAINYSHLPLFNSRDFAIISQDRNRSSAG